MTRWILLLSFAVSSVAFGQSKSPVTSGTLAQQLASTEAELNKLRVRVDALENQSSFVQFMLARKQDRVDEIVLDLTAKGFNTLDTGEGPVLVGVSDVSPYLNGYKIRLDVGNPLDATYSNFAVTVEWGKSYDWAKFTQTSYQLWQKSLQTKETSFSEKLFPGTWNHVDLIIAPASAEDLGYVKLSMAAKTIELSRVP